MNAQEFLIKKGLHNRTLNPSDLIEYWVTVSQIMEEYAKLQINTYVGEKPTIYITEFSDGFCLTHCGKDYKWKGKTKDVYEDILIMAKKLLKNE